MGRAKYIEERVLICRACSSYRDHFRLLWIKWFKKKPQCKECKCLIELSTRFKWKSCPKGKWKLITE